MNVTVLYLWSNLVQYFQNSLTLPTSTPQTATFGILNSASNDSIFKNNKVFVKSFFFFFFLLLLLLSLLLLLLLLINFI